ncbi:MAG TPA: sigma-70 family RNA polymerase sigma factor [Lachnospiraceae bacterium]|nr:sigma-70 family RNA polymerase sigma factor [Lachnospiraceae bacterium]
MITSYQHLIFTICYKFTNNYFDAEDLTQDTFLSAYKHLENFDGNNPKSWLCRIATNKCLDFKKRAASGTVPTDDSFFLTIETDYASPEKEYLEVSVKKELLACCNSLSPPYAEVAREYFYNERTVSELARLLNRNEKTLRTQIYRAKGMLRKLYGKEVRS